MNRPSAPHWLSSVAQHAGLELTLPATPDLVALRNAWTAVVRACKVPEECFIERVAGHFRLGVADVSTWDPQGRELLREVRKSLVTQCLPVIIISSASDPQVEIDLLEAGADDYMTKPVNADRVEARVRAVLRRSGVELS